MKPTALILASITSLRQNIKYTLKPLTLDFYEYEDSSELLSFLETPDQKRFSMVFIDMDSREEDRLEVLGKIQERHPFVPMIALTSDTKKEKILTLIMRGASDVIAKPFSEKILLEKTGKLIKKREQASTEEIHMDFPALLRRELFKAQKGSYAVSVMIASFFKPEELQNQFIEEEYYRLSSLIKGEIEDLLFETDHLLQYGSQTFVGVLPFCDEVKRKIVQEKVENRFQELKEKEPAMKAYQLGKYFVTYPSEGDEANTLTEKLTEGLRENIDKSLGNQ